MTDSDVKPPHMSDVQWQDIQAARAAHQMARTRGIGMVQISARRFDVIVDNGASASKSGAGPWFGYISFRVVENGHNLPWEAARNLIRVLNTRLDADHRDTPDLKIWAR